MSKTRRRWQWSTTATAVTMLAVMLTYASFLTFYYLVSGSEPELAPVDQSAARDETVALVTLQAMNSPDHLIQMTVRVLPARALIDPRLDVLKSDIAVWLDPSTDLGELKYASGSRPTEVSATMPVTGATYTWPLDKYTTGPISADMIVGSGEGRKLAPVRVEVTGDLEDWDVNTVRSGPDGHEITLNLSRTKGQLGFDIGIFMILLVLPAACMYVAVQTARGRKKFLPPMTTWFAAVLFAIIPLRNILPGAPPAGVWVDHAVVLWVLVTLVTAMVIYLIGWHRDAE